MPKLNRPGKQLNGNKIGPPRMLNKTEDKKPPAKIKVPRVPKRPIKEKPIYLEEAKPKPPKEENNLFV